METYFKSEISFCENCQTEMTRKPADMTSLDINKLSLIVMFRIRQVELFQCPCCKKENWYLNETR